MMKTIYVERELVQQLMEAVALRAKLDYIDALAALRRGKLTVHNKSCVALMKEIEEWIYLAFDYEVAEQVVQQFRQMGPESSAGRSGAHKIWV